MKKLQIIFVLVILTFVLSSKLSAQVKLITEVAVKKYSKADSELKAVDIKLKLQFTNESDIPILIYKNDFEISHIWISKNIESLTARSFEQSSSLTNLALDLLNIENLSLKDFIMLRKNEKYETTATVRLFVPYESGEQITGAISEGNHALQIQFYNWNWTKKEAKNKQSELEKYGKILIDPIISEPMDFTIE